MFMLFGFSALIHLVVGFIIYGVEEAFIKILFNFILIEILVYHLGAVIYYKRFPESYSSVSKYDYVGSSHQLWHILVVIGTIFHLTALIKSCRLITDVAIP